jgi:hypothetical protein
MNEFSHPNPELPHLQSDGSQTVSFDQDESENNNNIPWTGTLKEDEDGLTV